MHDDDVLRAEAARELERLLQPLADAEVGEDPPGFVDDDDPLREPLVGLRLDLGLQPGGRARHQDPERGRVRVQDGPEVEDDERRVEVEARRGRAVEHPAEVPAAELVEREGHRAHRVGDLVDLHRERVGHLAGGMKRTSTTSGRVGSSIGASCENEQRLLAGALLLGRERPLERGGGDGVEEVELPLGAAARRERVEPHLTARRERDRLHAERFGEPVVLALDVDDPRLPAEDGLAEHVGLDEARLRPADDADHDGVRARQFLAVELPRVVAERSAVDVAADVDAASAEPALGDERVRGLDVGGRPAVAGLALALIEAPGRAEACT